MTELAPQSVPLYSAVRRTSALPLLFYLQTDWVGGEAAREHPEDGASVLSHQVKPNRERRIGRQQRAPFCATKNQQTAGEETNTRTGVENTGQIPEPNLRLARIDFAAR